MCEVVVLNFRIQSRTQVDKGPNVVFCQECGCLTLHPTPCTLHPALYTLHPTPYTLHPTPCTLHLTPTPYNLHPTPYTLPRPPPNVDASPPNVNGIYIRQTLREPHSRVRSTQPLLIVESSPSSVEGTRRQRTDPIFSSNSVNRISSRSTADSTDIFLKLFPLLLLDSRYRS